MLAKADADGSGTIGFAEFVAVLCPPAATVAQANKLNQEISRQKQRAAANKKRLKRQDEKSVDWRGDDEEEGEASSLANASKHSSHGNESLIHGSKKNGVRRLSVHSALGMQAISGNTVAVEVARNSMTSSLSNGFAGGDLLSRASKKSRRSGLRASGQRRSLRKKGKNDFNASDVSAGRSRAGGGMVLKGVKGMTNKTQDALSLPLLLTMSRRSLLLDAMMGDAKVCHFCCVLFSFSWVILLRFVDICDDLNGVGVYSFTLHFSVH